MNILRPKERRGRKPRKSEKRSENFVGMCPFCGFSSTLEIEECPDELTLICRKCNLILFYLDKIHTPPHEKEMEDLIELDEIDPYVYKPY
ncbi:hypothetical protein LR066_05780 [candidate division WOR-3 bacterium]|nr:hypothetical protein [candidate division WOR-3 bacterium]